MAELSKDDKTELMATLQSRFEANMNRHENIQWKDVEEKLYL